MTLDQANAFLAACGHYLSSIGRLAPELGYLATSRAFKGRGSSAGEEGFGKTAQAALDNLIAKHGGPVSAPPADDLEELLG